MASRPETRKDTCRIVSEPIDLGALGECARSDACGAVALFAGVVRDHRGRFRADRLEYEAYRTMAEAELRRIIAEAGAGWVVGDNAPRPVPEPSFPGLSSRRRLDA